MFKYVLLFGLGYALGKANKPAAPSEWLDDVLIQGFAADQVAAFDAAPDVEQAAKAASSATGIPALWFAKLAAAGVAPLKFITAAKAITAKAIALGPPKGTTADLAAWRESVLQAGAAAGK